MRRHHTGSGRSTTTVIPDDWQTNHAGVIAATYSALITIGNPEAAATMFNDTTGATQVTPAAVLYDGPAAIAAASGAAQLLAADEQESTRTYEISLPVAIAGIKPGHVVRVVSSPDPMLVGRDLVVNAIQLGDRRFSRILQAVLND